MDGSDFHLEWKYKRKSRIGPAVKIINFFCFINTDFNLPKVHIGEGNGNPLQYSCLENSMDGEAVGYSPWGCKSRTRLSDFTFKVHINE